MVGKLANSQQIDSFFVDSALLGLRRTHEDSNWGRGLVVAWGRVIERACVRLIDPQDGWNTRWLDVEDPGVHDLTVDLHHHLKLFVFYDALCSETEKQLY